MMRKSYDELLAEFRRDVHGGLGSARAQVGGARFMLEMKLRVEGTELELSPAWWGRLAHLGTLDKLATILGDERDHGTFELLASARNMFENLVWLKFLNQDYRHGLVFYARFLSDELASLASYIGKIADEAALFDTASELDRDGLHSAFGQVQDQPDDDAISAAQGEHRQQIALLDDMVRREFSLYADSATFMGYGYQAHLLREEVLPDMERRRAEAQQKQAKLHAYLEENYPVRIAKLAKQKWNWSERASGTGLQRHYDFIYGLTSRLLHSSPLNIITEKSLTDAERVLVMDYHVVAGGDLLREMASFNYPGKAEGARLRN